MYVYIYIYIYIYIMYNSTKYSNTIRDFSHVDKVSAFSRETEIAGPSVRFDMSVVGCQGYTVLYYTILYYTILD